MPLEPNVFIDIELRGAGAGWTDISADLVRDTGLLIRHGMSGGAPIDRVSGAAPGSFSLYNDARKGRLLGTYSLFHRNKKIGWGLGIGCRIRLQDPNSRAIVTRLVGRIDAIDPAPGLYRDRRVIVTVVDWMDEAARWALTPDVGEQVGKTGDQVLTAILAQMPYQPTATSFDVGTEAYPYALDTSGNARQAALSEFGKLAASELGFIYVKANGTLRYEGRHQRLIDTTSDWILSDSEFTGLTMPASRDDIINTVRVTAHQKIVDAEPSTVIYNQANPIRVNAGETKFLLGPYRDPLTGDAIGGTDVQTQIAGSDYVANSSDDGTGTDLTSSFAIVVTAGQAGASFSVTNSSGTSGYLTTNQLLGKGIYDRGTVTCEATDVASVLLNGEHAVNFDMPYQGNVNVAQAAADYLLAKYKDALAQAKTVTVLGKNPFLVSQILARDISDRITLSEQVTGLSNAFFINGIELRILPSRYVEATYTLAPAADPFSGMYWILGTSVLGTSTIPAPF